MASDIGSLASVEAAGTLCHIDSLKVGHDPGLFQQVRGLFTWGFVKEVQGVSPRVNAAYRSLRQPRCVAMVAVMPRANQRTGISRRLRRARNLHRC